MDIRLGREEGEAGGGGGSLKQRWEELKRHPAARWLREKSFVLFAIDTRALAFVRMGLAAVLLFDLWVRATDFAAFLSDDGAIPCRTVLDANTDPFLLPSLHLTLCQSDFLMKVLLLVAALAAVCLLFGYKTQLSNALSFFFLSSLHFRTIPVMNGGDTLLRLALFWLMFLPSGTTFSIDNALDKGKHKKPRHYYSFRCLGMMTQIFIMYYSSTYHKTDESWQDGTALYFALNIDYYVTSLGLIVRQYIELMRFLTFATLALERYGSLLLFCPFFVTPLRILLAMSFIGFHSGIGLTMNVGIFVPVPCIIICVFLPTWFWDKVASLPTYFARFSRFAEMYYDKGEDETTGRFLRVYKECCLLPQSRLLRTTLSSDDITTASRSRNKSAFFDSSDDDEEETEEDVPLVEDRRVTKNIEAEEKEEIGVLLGSTSRKIKKRFTTTATTRNTSDIEENRSGLDKETVAMFHQKEEPQILETEEEEEETRGGIRERPLRHYKRRKKRQHEQSFMEACRASFRALERRAALVDLEQSHWIAVDENKEEHEGYFALVASFRASPFLCFLAPLMRLPYLRDALKVLWEFMAFALQLVGSGKKVRRVVRCCLPFWNSERRSIPVRIRHALANVIFFLFFMWLLANAIKSVEQGYHVPGLSSGPVTRVIRGLQLGQKWLMFRSPYRGDGWWLMEGTTKDGRQVDAWKWYLTNNDTLIKEKPSVVGYVYPNQRWRKFMMNLNSKNHQKYRAYFSHFLCRVWNEKHEEGQRLLRIEGMFMEEYTPPPELIDKIEVRPVRKWSHDCARIVL
ncbi:hypothetical protein QOT17_010215 [Balamuthia mandrillaris]